jgi:hypothetical protein
MKSLLVFLVRALAACASVPNSAEADDQSMVVALIAGQLASETSYIRQNIRQPFYISVGSLDISTASAAKLSASGFVVFPASAWA